MRVSLVKMPKILFGKTLIKTIGKISNKYPITSRKDDNNYIIRKFDFINSWQGSILYFLFLILTLFLINRYYISNIKIIDFQIIEEKAKEK